MDDHKRCVNTEILNASDLDLLQVAGLMKLKAEAVNAVAQLSRILP
jgi:hypothetical protein